MQKIFLALIVLTCLGAGCDFKESGQTSVAVNNPSDIGPSGLPDCIPGTDSKPWYQGPGCSEVTESRASETAPEFISAKASQGMIWYKNVLTAKAGARVALTVVVKDAKSVSLEMLVWNEGSYGEQKSFPLQKQKDGSFKIIFTYPDFSSFEYNTTYALHAEGIKENNDSLVHLVLDNSYNK